MLSTQVANDRQDSVHIARSCLRPYNIGSYYYTGLCVDSKYANLSVFFFLFRLSVDPDTGQVCADFLDDLSCWKEFYSISYMLLSIQV